MNLVQARAQQSWDLLDEGVGAEEGVIALGQPLDLLLVLVELLEVVSGHAGETFLLRLIAVSLVPEDADAELLARNILQPGYNLDEDRTKKDSRKALKDSGSVSEFG